MPKGNQKGGKKHKRNKNFIDNTKNLRLKDLVEEQNSMELRKNQFQKDSRIMKPSQK